MKIGIISNLYPPFIRGGAEIIAAMQAEGLKEAWQHVFVISTRPANVKVVSHNIWQSNLWNISKDEINEVVVYRFNPINIYYYLDDYKHPSFVRLLWHLFDSFNIFSYFKVKKILLKERPDVIITHNLMGLGFLIPHLLKKLKIKHVHILHDVQLVTPSGLILKDQENCFEHKFFKIIGYVKIMRYLIGNPDLLISPSKFLFEFYQQHKFFSKSKKIVLPNPVKSLVKLNKIPSAKLELIYIGQINKAKGVLEMVRSFKKIKLSHLKLHIVGVGEDLKKIKKLAKDDKRIIFYGWMPHQKLIQIISKADVLLVPSLCYENSPTVIYESLSMGLPVITADIGGAAELIKEGINGWTFPAGDFDALNKKIMSIFKQREKIALMRYNCHRSIYPYLLDNYTNKLLELIND